MKKTSLIIITIIACLSGILYYKEYNKNIFFIGNSITAYGLSPDIGWYGNWGMAASSEDNDFVHKTVEKLKNPRFQVINLGEFEYRYSAMDLSFLRPYKNAKPFVLVYQAGENVDPNKIDELKYTEHVQSLIKYINPKHVIIISEFWPDPHKFQTMLAFTKANGYSYVDISKVMFIDGATAKGKYKNDAVALHPSDKGMELISDELLKTIQPIFKK
ncbi:MAG: SGNH/GDSL hydrolase family protein [Aeromonas veronii]